MIENQLPKTNGVKQDTAALTPKHFEAKEATLQNVVSLDIETTGLYPLRHGITEIALVHQANKSELRLHIDPGMHVEWDPWSIENTAAVTLGIGAHAQPPIQAQRRIVKWFGDIKIEPGKAIALGWNVGSFDLAFIRRYLPAVFAWFTYRSIDLTAIRYTLDLVRPIDGGWGDEFKRLAALELGGSDQHNALWDARAALVAWEHALAVLGGEPNE